MKSFIIGSEEVEMKKEMTWEEWYYKYYPRVAKKLLEIKEIMEGEEK